MMESIKRVIILLAIFTISSKTCDGQILDFIQGAGVAIENLIEVTNIIQSWIHPEDYTDEVDQNELLNEKLDGLSSQMQQMEKGMNRNFKQLFKEIAKKTTDGVVANIAQELETCIINMGNEFEHIADTAKNVKNGIYDPHDVYILNDLSRFSKNIDNFKTTIRGIVYKKSFAVDFLSNVKKEGTNVCKSKTSQLQELDRFRALYVETMMKYLISEHLIILMFESLGTPDRNNTKKISLNKRVQKYLNNDLTRFQKVMASASREFQKCTEPSQIYKIGHKYNESKSCYIIERHNKNQPSTGKITSLNDPFSLCWYYFSLRPANAKPGYVVLGARIEKNVNILYIRVIQGKLLPSGLIDPKSISYNDDLEHGIGDTVVKAMWKVTTIDLTETVASKNRVITGLRFAKSNKGHIYLEVISTEINVKKSLLHEETVRSEKHTDGTTPYEVKYTKDDAVIRSPTGLQSVKSNQYVKLKFYGRDVRPFIDGDAIFPTPLTLLSGASLYIKEEQGKPQFLSIRFHTFNIVPHIKIKLDVNQNFTDILNKL